MKIRTKLILGFAAISVTVSSAAAIGFFATANAAAIDEYRRRALGAVAQAALQQDGDAFDRIRSAADPEYERVRLRNLRIRHSDPQIAFVFTVRKDARGLSFVVDAGEPGEKDIAAFGERYEDPSPTLAANYDTMTGPVADPEMYTDRWGSFLSGYAPLFSADGRRVGAIGVDIKGETVIRTRRHILAGALLMVAGAALFGVLLGALAGTALARPIAELDQGANRLAAGELGHRVRVDTGDEIGALAASLNLMAEKNEGLVRGLEERVEERRAAVEMLRESEQKYRTLVEHAGEAIFVAQDGGIPFANPMATRLVGYTGAHLRGMRWAALVHPDDLPLVRERNRSRLAGEAVPGTAAFRVMCQGGDARWVHLNSVRIAWEGRPATLNFARDVTEQLRLEELLRQSQKMEAIGTLAGGIAHDFNNILAIIMGHAELALLKISPGNAPAGHLDEILKASERARQLVAQILTISRRAESKAIPCDLGPIVKETLKFLRSLLPASIEIRAHLEASGTVVVDPTNLHQVVMNLGTNAFHAMEDRGGVLEVSLGDVRIEEADAASQGLEAGRYARLTVSDTGTGIAPETVHRIFEPYFTTKEAGKGTGLGLSVVHGIVTTAGGALKVYSEPGLGTTFHVYLPVSASPGPGQTEQQEESARGTERVLLVDDEPTIVALEQESLEALGYRVTARTSPAEALAAFLAQPTQFDLVITDLTMPRLNGEALARKVLEARPGLPVLICTGFSEALTAERVQAIGVRGVLTKPVPRARLARAVREALEHG
jgi:PAS domain S-box-containing protein